MSLRYLSQVLATNPLLGVLPSPGRETSMDSAVLFFKVSLKTRLNCVVFSEMEEREFM